MGIFPYFTGAAWLIPHAELSPEASMEQASHCEVFLLVLFLSLLFQVHWRDAGSCWSGRSSGFFFFFEFSTSFSHSAAVSETVVRIPFRR